MTPNANEAISYLGAIIGFRDAWPLHFALIVVMVLDVLSGTIAAIGTRTLSSNVSWKGMMRKAGTWVVVGLAHVVEGIVGVPVVMLIVLGFVAGEGLSILENCGRLGILPPFLLKSALQKLAEGSSSVTVVSEQTKMDIHIPESSIPGGRRQNDPPPLTEADTVIIERR